MTFKEITELIKLVNKTNLTEFKLKEGDIEISIRTDKYTKAAKSTQVVTSAPSMMPVSSQVPVPGFSQAAPASAPAPVPKAPTSANESVKEDTSNLLEVKSPIVGTFYRSPSPEKPAYVKVGDKIGEGDTVCIVEAMKLFNEIESEVSGTIVKVLVEDAQPVEYDQVLFLVDPN